VTFTYGNDPVNVPRDAIRSMLHDTTESGAIWTDEDIAWALVQKPNTLLAASLLAKRGIAKYAGTPTKKVGDLSLTYNAAVAYYGQLGEQLRLEGVRSVVPYSGGISKTDKAARRADTDRLPTHARVGIHDHPETPESDSVST
jgi:hypothetical protein